MNKKSNVTEVTNLLREMDLNLLDKEILIQLIKLYNDVSAIKFDILLINSIIVKSDSDSKALEEEIEKKIDK